MIQVKKTILIPIETISREFDYKIYLSMKLSIFGYRVVLGPKESIWRSLKYYKNFIYIDKGYHKGISEVLFNEIKKNHGIVVSLDEEGAVDFKDNSNLKGRYSQFLIENSSIILFWGINQKNMVVKNLNLKNFKNFAITGHPRFHLLKYKFYNIYKNDVIEISNKFRNFFLINTNFGFGNNLKGDDFAQQNYGTRLKNIKDIIIQDKKKIKIIFELVKSLTENYNNIIVIRPHPEENLDIYNNEFIKNDQVKIIREKSSIPWVMACDACFHIDCTTGIESVMLEKKTISYQSETLDQKFLHHLPISVSSICNSISDVKNILKSDEKIYRKKNAILDEYFSFNKSIDNLINIINKTNTFKISYYQNNYFDNLIYNLKLKIRHLLSFLNRYRLDKSKLKGYSYKLLNLRFIQFKKSSKKFNNCKISKKDNTYIFSSDD